MYGLQNFADTYWLSALLREKAESNFSLKNRAGLGKWLQDLSVM